MIKVKVLGTGCSKCSNLEKAVQTVVTEHGIDAEIEKIEDIVEIMQYAVMNTPGLVINEKLVATGRIPSASEIKNFLEQ